MPPRPILLTKGQLLAPIFAAQRKLSEIKNSAPTDKQGALFREGLFVLAVSTAEVMLFDVMAELLRQIPAKLPDKSFSVTKESLVERQFNIIEEQIQQYLIGLSYKKLDEFLDAFCDCLAIDIGSYRSNHGNSLLEIKESRNLLIHNNLVVNSIYLSKAGPKSRSSKLDERLSIDAEYFENAIDVLEQLCTSCCAAISAKYASYTTAKAIQDLWEYIFHTPVLRFDDYWEVIDKEDTVHLKTTKFHGGISGSEAIFLGVWLNHFNQAKNKYIEHFCLHHLDDSNKEKMLWLIGALREFRLY